MQWMRDSIEEAMRRLEERRIEPGDVIVPRAWAAALGQYYRRERTGTMHMIFAVGEENILAHPRVAPPYGPGSGFPRVIGMMNRYLFELIDTEDDMDDKRLKELPTDVVSALKGLINKELESGSKTCFARAGKVAELAQSLAGMYYTRVEDVKEAHEAMGMLNPTGNLRHPEVGYAFAQGVGGPGGRPQAPEDTVRDALSTAMPLLRTMSLHTLMMLKPQAAALGIDESKLDTLIKAGADRLLTDAEPLASSSAPKPDPSSPPASAAGSAASRAETRPLRVAEVELGATPVELPRNVFVDPPAPEIPLAPEDLGTARSRAEEAWAPRPSND